MRQPPGKSAAWCCGWIDGLQPARMGFLSRRRSIDAHSLADSSPCMHLAVRWRRQQQAGITISRSRWLLLALFLCTHLSSTAAFTFRPPAPSPSSRRMQMLAATEGDSPSSPSSHTLRKRRIRIPTIPLPFRSHKSTANQPTLPSSTLHGGGGDGSRRRSLLPSLRGATANEHDADIWRLSGPALLTLVVDPALSLVDTAYVGRWVVEKDGGPHARLRANRKRHT